MKYLLKAQTNLLQQAEETKQATAADSSFLTNIQENIENLAEMPLEDQVSYISHGLVNFGLKVLGAAAVYFIGRWIIRYIKKFLDRIMKKRHVDISLQSFIVSLISITLNLFLFIVVVGILGIDNTSFVAIFAAAGLAVGMALSGTLQNFAGGVLILALKPFRVGDYIEALGESGTVKEIQLFNTILDTPDNRVIILPNGNLSTGIIDNSSRETTRRIDFTFSIAYGQDYDTAKSTIMKLIQADQRVKDIPAPLVAVNALSESSVKLTVQIWVAAGDYWGVFYSLNEQVYKTFSSEGINIPNPQLDVHLYAEEKEEQEQKSKSGTQEKALQEFSRQSGKKSTKISSPTDDVTKIREQEKVLQATQTDVHDLQLQPQDTETPKLPTLEPEDTETSGETQEKAHPVTETEEEKPKGRRHKKVLQEV